MAEVFHTPPREVAEAAERFLDESHIVTHARTPSRNGTGKGQVSRSLLYGNPGKLPSFCNDGERYEDGIRANRDQFLDPNTPTGFGLKAVGIDVDFFEGMPVRRPILLARELFTPNGSPAFVDDVVVNEGYQIAKPGKGGMTSPWQSSTAEYYRHGRVSIGPSAAAINVRPAALTHPDGTHKFFSDVPGTQRDISLFGKVGTRTIQTVQPAWEEATTKDAKLPGARTDNEPLAFTRWRSGGNMYKFLTSMQTAHDLFRGYGDENETMASVAVAALLKELIARHDGDLVYFHSDAYLPKLLDFQVREDSKATKTDLDLTGYSR